MQQVFPMDTVTSRKDVNSPDGFVKITLGKLYRVTGQTTQLNGVVPDVLLPDAYDGLEYMEKFSPHVLSSDTVKRNAYYRALSDLPIQQLAAASEQRVINSRDFQAIRSTIKLQTDMMKAGKEIIPLKLDLFEKWMKQKEAEQKIMNETEKQASKIFS